MGMEGILPAESRLIINCVDRYAAFPPAAFSVCLLRKRGWTFKKRPHTHWSRNRQII